MSLSKAINILKKDDFTQVMTEGQEGFIIYPTYRIEYEKAFVYLFGRLKDGRSFCTKNIFEPYFYVKTSDMKKISSVKGFTHEETELKNFEENKITKIKVAMPSQVPELRKLFENKGVECYEADIKFPYRFMMDKGLLGSVHIKGKSKIQKGIRVDAFFDEPELKSENWKPDQKDLKILAIDIETSMSADALYCISLCSNDDKLKKVIIVSDKKIKHAESYRNEKELLEAFRTEIIAYDPDIITGWNLIDFDFDVLEKFMKKYNINFDLGRTEDKCKLKIVESFMMDSKADFPGRIILDGIHLLKSSFIKLDDYKLGTAAKEFTKKEKLIDEENKGEEIETSFKDNPQKLADYNLMDSELVLEIIEKSGSMQLTILRSMLTGMPLDRVRASIASLDSLYLRKLKERGYVAPAAKYVDREERTTGGYVMSPKPGIYDYVLVFDFKSLYPSIMRTFNIDPLMFRGKKPHVAHNDKLIIAPNGASFSKEKGILPEILDGLWEERETARKKKDELTRWAIKILMNSMYGVMASPNCRFYNTEIANAITSFGHQMIKGTAVLVEDKGYEVIYGDTDSIFVHLKVDYSKDALKIGKEMEKEINDYYNKKITEDYGVKSALELEFEKTFIRFFMPKVRGSEEGAKKRYAGLLLKGDKETMDFTGLEFVRRDWTELSKKFQLELLEMVFHHKDPKSYIKQFVKDLKKGKYDSLLVYRKALRKDTEEYTKTTPPHVKAARLLDKITSNIIDYVMTKEGPEPIQKITHELDYEHYIDKQIKPLADAILYFYDTNFDDILLGSAQRSLGDW
jgi:DNA polymerase-2